MTSPNDNSILSALTMYPDMDRSEVDTYIERLETAESISVAQAVTGIISPDELSTQSRRTYDEYMNWSRGRQRQIRNEELSARHAERETRRASKMIELREKGILSDEALILYGISGPLPDRQTYLTMSDEDKEHLWASRMERRYGPRWREVLNLDPNFLRMKCEKITHDWLKEGF